MAKPQGVGRMPGGLRENELRYFVASFTKIVVVRDPESWASQLLAVLLHVISEHGGYRSDFCPNLEVTSGARLRRVRILRLPVIRTKNGPTLDPNQADEWHDSGWVARDESDFWHEFLRDVMVDVVNILMPEAEVSARIQYGEQIG